MSGLAYQLRDDFVKDWSGRGDSNPRRPAWKVFGSKRCGSPNGQGSERRPVIYSSKDPNCRMATVNVTIWGLKRRRGENHRLGVVADIQWASELVSRYGGEYQGGQAQEPDAERSRSGSSGNRPTPIPSFQRTDAANYAHYGSDQPDDDTSSG